MGIGRFEPGPQIEAGGGQRGHCGSRVEHWAITGPEPPNMVPGRHRHGC